MRVNMQAVLPLGTSGPPNFAVPGDENAGKLQKINAKIATAALTVKVLFFTLDLLRIDRLIILGAVVRERMFSYRDNTMHCVIIALICLHFLIKKSPLVNYT
jgi:hypothetical protein